MMKKKEQHTQERIRLAMDKVKQAETIKDVGLVVSHDALPLLTAMLETSMRRIIREEIKNAAKEFSLGLLEGMIPKYLPAPEEPAEDPEEVEKPVEEPEPVKSKPKKNAYTDQEKAGIKLQYRQLKKSFPNRSENWILGKISLPGRSNQSIKNFYHRILKEEMNHE